MPLALSVWIRNCLSIFCVTTLRLLCSVCLASQSKGLHFSSALEADFGFSGKAPRWVLRINTAGSLWLQKGGAVSPFFTLLLYVNIKLPMSLLQQVSRQWLMYLLAVCNRIILAAHRGNKVAETKKTRLRGSSHASSSVRLMSG